MVNGAESVGITEYMMQQTGCGINRNRYNRVPLHLNAGFSVLHN